MKSKDQYIYIGIGASLLGLYFFVPGVKNAINGIVGNISGNGSLAAANAAVQSKNEAAVQALSSENSPISYYSTNYLIDKAQGLTESQIINKNLSQFDLSSI